MVACKRVKEERILLKHNLITLSQLYQTDVLFRSHDQMGHQERDKVQQRILHRFDWPGMRKVCKRWVNACLSRLQVKNPKKKKLPLKSVKTRSLIRSCRLNIKKSEQKKREIIKYWYSKTTGGSRTVSNGLSGRNLCSLDYALLRDMVVP